MAARFDVNDVATVTCPGMDPTLYSDGCGYPDTAVRSPYVVLGSSPPDLHRRHVRLLIQAQAQRQT